MSKKAQNRSETPEFEAALRRARRSVAAPQPYCKGSEATYVDYAEAPSRREAEAMCAPCPLLALCRASAKEVRPSWGIRGGIAWEGGKQLHWKLIALAS